MRRGVARLDPARRVASLVRARKSEEEHIRTAERRVRVAERVRRVRRVRRVWKGGSRDRGVRGTNSTNTHEKYPLHECTPTFRQPGDGSGRGGRDGRFRAVENGVGEDVDM